MGKVSGNITEKIEEFTSSQEQQGEVAIYLKKVSALSHVNFQYP
jgi:hypothetical protein